MVTIVYRINHYVMAAPESLPNRIKDAFDNNRAYVEFSFNNIKCNTINTLNSQPFWMYFLHEDDGDVGDSFVTHRVLVVNHTDKRPKEMESISRVWKDKDNPTRWFRCNQIQRIYRQENYGLITHRKVLNNNYVNGRLTNSIALIRPFPIIIRESIALDLAM